MKIILTTTYPSLDANMDPRFGRCAYFILVDTETLVWHAYPNPGVSSSGGAGSLAAQFISDQNVEAVISGDFGPNADNALQAAGVAMFLFGDSHTARQAVEHFKADMLKRVGAPTGHGHHGSG